MDGELKPVYVPPDKVLEPSGEQVGSYRETRQRRIRTGIVAFLGTLFVVSGWCGLLKHEQEIDRSTEQVSALVKELGYISAKAYKPTENHVAYITLHAPGCTVGDPEVVVDNVTAQLQEGQNGYEIAYFMHKEGDEKVDGKWTDIFATWRTPGELCDVLANR